MKHAVRMPRIKRVDGAIPLKASGGKRPHRAREYGSAALATTIVREQTRKDRQAEQIGRHLEALARVLDLRDDEINDLVGLLVAGADFIKSKRL